MTPTQREAALRLADWHDAYVWHEDADATTLPTKDGRRVNVSHRESAALLRELAQEPQRKPLTDEQIGKLRADYHSYQSGRIGSFIDLCRAIERAHGITGEQAMTPTQREAALRLAAELTTYSSDWWRVEHEAAALLRELATVADIATVEPAPGYCRHCKQYTIEEPLAAEPQSEPVVRKIADVASNP